MLIRLYELQDETCLSLRCNMAAQAIELAPAPDCLFVIFTNVASSHCGAFVNPVLLTKGQYYTKARANQCLI